MKKRSIILILLVIVLALGAYFRVSHLTDQSLWLDEGVTYYNSSAEGFSGVWEKTAKLDQSPPGYYFVTHSYLEIFGENEFGFRLISVVIGVLAILFLYLLGAAVFNEETGLIAAFLLAINEFHIGFSMEARMYGLLALLGLIGFFAMHKAIKHESRGYLWWLLLAASSIAGIYSHNFYFFVLLALGVVFLMYIVSWELKLGKVLMGVLTAILVVVAYIPWIPSFLKQMSVERYWLPENQLSDLYAYLLDYSGGSQVLLLIFVSLSIAGFLYGTLKRKSDDYKQRVLSVFSVCIFLIVSLLAPLLYSLKFEPILKIRYTVYFVPVFMLIAAHGLYAIRKVQLFFMLAALAVILYLSSPWQESAYPVEFGEDFRSLVEEVKKDPAPMVVHTPSIAHVINFYNKGAVEVWPFPFSDDLSEFNIDESYKGKYMDLIRRFESFYLVDTHSHENPYGLLKTWSDAECLKSSKLDLDGMEVIHFQLCK